MNKAVLLCGAVALVVFGGFLLVKDHGTKVVPYYVPQHVQTLPNSPKSIFQDPPSLAQMKKDLGGKTVVITGRNHQFVGPEVNFMTVLATNPTETGVAVDLQVCADLTIVERAGTTRKRYSHENVCGSMRVYYDKKDDKWSYRMAENIDLQKIITPNKKAPPSNTQVWRYR